MERSYKALPLIAMAYVTTKLMALLLFYKVITVFSITAAASTLIIPLWFCLGDVITEVYGYKIAKQLVLMSVICQLIFGCVPSLLNLFPSAVIGVSQGGYNEVVGNLPRGAIASVLAIGIGGIVNAWVLNKWKLILNNKYFILRSLGSTAIGELTFTICVYVIGFHGVTSFTTIIKLIMVSYVIKLTVNPIMILPINLLTQFVKRYENVDIKGSTDLYDSINNYDFSPKLTVLANDDNGESHFTEEEIPLIVKYAIGLHSKEFSAKSFLVRHIDEARFIDWHPITQPQYVIYLAGRVEIEASNGEKRIFGPGDILFYNDLIGKGHIARILSAGLAVYIRV